MHMKHLDKMLLALCMLLFPFLGAKAFDVPDCATYVDGKNFCYLEVPSTWDPYIWAWEDGGGSLYAAWPGSNADLTQVGTNGANAVYRWTEPSTSTITVTTFICSNNGGDKLGGGNLDFVNGGYYTADDIQAIITATGVATPDQPTDDLVTVYFDNSTANWETPHIYYWGNKSPEWPGVPMTLYKDKVWKYDCPKGTTDCLFNAGDGDRTKTGDMVVKNGHIYNTSGDLGEYNGSVIPDPDPDPVPDTKYYAMHGDIIGGSWASTLLTDDDNDGWYSVAATFQAGEFGIKVLKSTDNIQGTADQIAWIGGGADITEADKVYSMAGDDNSWNALEGAYIFSFNPETKEAKMTVNGVGPDPDPEYPDGLVVVGTMNDWTLAAGIFLTREGDTYTAEVGDLEADTEFKIAVIGEEWTRSWGGQGVIDPDVTEQVATVTPGVEMNAWEGSSVNFYISEEIKDAVITFKYAGADKSVPSKITVTGASEPDPRPVVPDNLYLVGDLASGSWNISAPQAMAKNGNEFSATNVEFVKGEGSQMSFFSFITATGADWDADVNSHDRYGSPSPNAMVVIGAPAPVKRYAAGVDASAAASWVVTPGTYDVTVDFDHMFVTLTRSTVGIDGVDSESGDTYYFDFNGMPVAKPASGQMYIVRKGAKVSKEIIR